MNPHKLVRVKQRFKHAHRAPMNVAAHGGMQHDVILGCLDPLDGVHRDPYLSASNLHPDRVLVRAVSSGRSSGSLFRQFAHGAAPPCAVRLAPCPLLSPWCGLLFLAGAAAACSASSRMVRRRFARSTAWRSLSKRT